MQNQHPRRRLVLGMLGVPALASTGLLAACDSVSSTVKIGVAQPLSGPLASWGQDMLNGVQMAAADINKEGLRVKGKPVTLEIISMDDKSNADEGKKAAQTLIDAGVIAVIGNLNSGVSIPAAPLYNQARIPQLAISTNPKFTQLGFDTTFRIVANDNLQAKAIASFAIDQIKGQVFTLLDDGTPYGKDLAALLVATLRKANKTIGLQLSLDDKKTDFNDVAPKIKEAKSDCLITVLNDFQIGPLIDALSAIEYTDVTILGADGLKTPETLKNVGRVKRIYASTSILDAQEFSAGRPWLERYRALYKKEPVYGGHYAYDALFVLAAAMRRAGSTEREPLIETLHKIDGFAPITGSMKWTAEGEQRFGVVGIYSATSSGWEGLMRSDAW